MVVRECIASCADIKILYFPFGGRGSALRLAAFIGNLMFEDEFISFEEFLLIKDNYNKIKWCTLPQIIVYEKRNEHKISKCTIGQSNACLRCIGWKCNLYPYNDAILAVHCDEIMDYVEDIMLVLAPSEFCGDENKKKIMREELSNGELLVWLKKLEWKLKENINNGYKNGYIVGNNFTIADCKLFCFIRHFGACEWREGYYKYIAHDILDTFPLLQKYKSFIATIESIKDFDKLWRKRHIGFKLKNINYPKCFVWEKRNKYEKKCVVNENQEYGIINDKGFMKESMRFIIFAAVLFLLFLVSNEPYIQIFGLLLFLGINETKKQKII